MFKGRKQMATDRRALDCLAFPKREGKPREKGLTIVRDYGFGYHTAEDLMDSVGEIIDYIKIRHFFTLMASRDEGDLVLRKIHLYRKNQIDVFPGGIVFELAYLQKKVESALEGILSMAFTAIEISENIIDMSTGEKERYIRMAADKGLKVFSEFGKKYGEEPFEVEPTGQEFKRLLAAGAKKITIERTELENVLGIKGENPESRRLHDLVEKVGLEHIVFEAETMEHQCWLFREFGGDVNVGPNIEPEKVAKLEPSRYGLSRESGYTMLTQLMKK